MCIRDRCSADDVALAVYAAENLATLEYKLLDEPMHILHELHLLHADVGMQVFGEARRRLAQRSPSPLTDEEDEAPAPVAHSLGLARAAVVVHIAQTLRSHLKAMYKISETYVALLTQKNRQA